MRCRDEAEQEEDVEEPPAVVVVWPLSSLPVRIMLEDPIEDMVRVETPVSWRWGTTSGK